MAATGRQRVRWCALLRRRRAFAATLWASTLGLALVAAACGTASSSAAPTASTPANGGAPTLLAPGTPSAQTTVAVATGSSNGTGSSIDTGSPGASVSASSPGSTSPGTASPGSTSTSTTSTTLGPRPPGNSGPYPWQAGPRLDGSGSPLYSWLNEAATVDAQGHSNPTAKLVFLGDSITMGWLSVGSVAWDAVWLPRDPLDFGITGDTTQNVLWRIQQGTLNGLNPRAVVLLIGTNDYGGGWSAAQVAQGIVACADAVRAKLPGAAIVMLSVFPRDTPTNPAAIAVQATNAELATAELPVNTTLVDMTPTLSTSAGAPIPALFSSDLLHPSPEGYEVIAGRLLAVPVLSQP